MVEGVGVIGTGGRGEQGVKGQGQAWWGQDVGQAAGGTESKHRE